VSSDVSRFTPPERLTALAADFGLSATTLEQLSTLVRILDEDPTAPTTVTDPTQTVDAHIADSLDVLALEAIGRAGCIADIGAGAGFPGLVLAAALPAARVQLVESVGKKCDFIRRAAESAGLSNVEIVNARAEDWPAGIGIHDVVTARALAPLGVLVEYAAPLLHEGGILVAWKGSIDARERDDAAAAAGATGMEFAESLHQPERPGAAERHLHVFKKVRATPERFPRRPGMARKRPISA
jgi:16S rRNA (guanine527-N7)-methyltransferase